ncbi:MAG: hypothetical protein IPI01_08125 [Ignavibacteriae bacterium]|nr:hypothetical protein [Ignavibacteriota bacterium]
MIDDRTLDLINRDLDGVASVDEHAALDALRASRKDVDDAYRGLLALQRALVAPQVQEPPPALKPAIMRAVTAHARPAANPTIMDRLVGTLVPLPLKNTLITYFTGDRMESNGTQPKSKRGTLLITAGVFAAMILVIMVAVKNPSVDPEDSAGTIGAVKKYNAAQIADQDVVLQGESENPIMADAATIGSVATVSEHARELARLAEGLKSEGKSVEGAQALADQARELAAQAEAVRSLGRAAEAAKYAEAAKELARNAEGLRSLGRTAEALKIQEAARALGKSAEGASAAVLTNEARVLAEGAREVARAAEGMKSLGKTAEAARLAEAAKEFARYAESVRSIGRTAESMKLAERVADLGAIAVGLKAEGKTALARTLESGVREIGRVAEAAKVIGAYEDGARAAEGARASEAAKALEGARTN